MDHVIATPAHGSSCTLRRYGAAELKIHSPDLEGDRMVTKQQQQAGAELDRLTTKRMQETGSKDYRANFIEVARGNPELFEAYAVPAEDGRRRAQHEAGAEVDKRAKQYMAEHNLSSHEYGK